MTWRSARLMTGLLITGLLAPVTAFADRLPTPPIPPSSPPRAELAPVPDPDIHPPAPPARTVELRPEFFKATRPDTSLAFAPGSRYQTADERRPLQTPGFLLTVPLR